MNQNAKKTSTETPTTIVLTSLASTAPKSAALTFSFVSLA